MIELSAGRAVPAAAYVPVLTQVLAGLAGTLRGHPVDPARIDDIVAAYPLDAFGSASEALSTAISDSGCIGVGNRQANQMLRRHLDAVYAYEFDVPAAPVSWPEVSFPYSSAHGNDLQYLFPGFSGGSGAPTALENDDDCALAEAMVGYWTTFAHHGDPNGGPTPRPTWNPYDPLRDNVMLLAPPTPREIEDFGGAHHSALWRTSRSAPADPTRPRDAESTWPLSRHGCADQRVLIGRRDATTTTSPPPLTATEPSGRCSTSGATASIDRRCEASCTA